MIRHIFILLILLPAITWGQYGNEWINYSQKYYEIPIAQTGVFKIDASTISNVLAETGDNLATIDPRNFQIFGRDQEQYIYVEGESDGTFDASDYILFYAKKNDIWLDSNLFDDPNLILNSERSFTSDSIRYFLTWNTSISNKRIVTETDVNFSSYTPADYCWRTNSAHFQDEYFVGDQHEGLSRSKYESAEGWSSLRYGIGGNHTVSISTVNAYYSGTAPAAMVETVSAGESNADSSTIGFNHKLIISYTDASASQIDVVDMAYTGYQVIRSTFNISNAAIHSNATSIKHRSVNLGQPSDYQTVGEVIVTYPHTFDFENMSWFNFALDATLGSKHDINISNFNGSNPNLWLFTGDAIKNLTMVSAAGMHEALVPNNATNTSQKLICFDDNQITNVTDLSVGGLGVKIFPVMQSGLFRELGLLNLDSAFIIVTHKSILSAARDYGAYRSSATGGGYDTVVIDIDELYRQYGGGVVKSGIAIRRFCQYTLDNWPSDPSNLFLVGKSVMEASEGNFANPAGLNWGIVQGLDYEYETCLVPSIGYPASDDYFSKQNSDLTLRPGIPTGRISVQSPQQVTDYLNKMILFEANQDPNSTYTIADKEWQKYALHFGGGATAIEQSTLRSYLQIYESDFENSGSFGGHVDTYLKVSTDPITPVIFDEVNQRIKDGVSLITFFGHASTEGFDQNIDSPDSWGNYGKYPVVIGLGCYAGDIHQAYTVSASEKFVLLPDQGGICFISTVKIGFTDGLNAYTTRFYDAFCNILYGKTIGQVFQYAKSLTNSTDIITQSGSIGNLSIQGDPAIRINPHAAPELVLDQSRVFIDPEQITVATDTFDFNVVITNIGQAIRDTVSIEITRTFPNGVDSIYLIDIPEASFRDTITIKMPLQPSMAEGINTFNIEVDLPRQYPEQYDDINNNKLIYSTYIQLDGIEPIYPYDFAIVPNPKMTLKASTVDPFAPVEHIGSKLIQVMRFYLVS
ncbi:MAG: hypothetical protein JKY54_19175 [Flavobacteriales bacterium]|nr:hypothetical protein [Flavobacteriales bacterium]